MCIRDRLRARLSSELNLDRASTFKNLHEANRTISQVLADNAKKIDAWLESAPTKGNRRLEVGSLTDTPTGRILERATDEIVDGDGVVVWLQKSDVFDEGYEIITAFPELAKHIVTG